MVQLSRLRLSGFKSFVDKTEVDIGNGLNGVVGPNGCGKSNLVEALRWVMGENRAKQMRGGEMEDVIFAGTSARPARSIAEVSLLIDNTDGNAPGPFGDCAQIEVTRKIEKGKGSQYLVNGKLVRARDVHMLFADALTGAHSPALVSQGRVTQLIQSKPTERRQMLEESAGVAALYTRRREAELRLKAADENLAKLDLIIGELTSRANSLRSQAKAALRYRDLSDTIRRLEMVTAWQDWVNTRDKLKKEEARFADTDGAVRETMVNTSALTVKVNDATEQVEILRKIDIEERAKLQLLRQSAQSLEADIARRQEEFKDLENQIAQSREDHSLADEQHNALIERIAVIASDLEKIESENTQAPEELARLEADIETSQEAVREAENNVLTLQDRLRRMESERDAAKRSVNNLESQKARIQSRIEELGTSLATLKEPNDDEATMNTAVIEVANIRATREGQEQALETNTADLETARSTVSNAQDTLAELRQTKGAKEREINTLSALIEQLSAGSEDALLLSLNVPADLATALTRAAGDAAARASANTDADCHWVNGNATFTSSDWPHDVQTMDTQIDAPKSLKSFLSSIGVVADVASGDRHAKTLKPGQMLVTREGHVWRWDGLISKDVGSEDAQARILTMRQQIKVAQDILIGMDPAIETASGALENAIAKKNTLSAKQNELQQSIRSLTQEIGEKDRIIERLQTSVNDSVVKRQLVEGQFTQAQEEETEIVSSLTDAAQTLDALMAADTDETLRNELTQGEQKLSEMRSKRDTIARDLEVVRASVQQTAQLVESLTKEKARTDEQIIRTQAHGETLKNRLESLQTRRDTLAPQIAADEAGTDRQDMLDKITECEEVARDASDAFEKMDQQAKAYAAELKKIENTNIDAREQRAVIQATVGALKDEQTRIASDIEERFSLSPSRLEDQVMVEFPDGVPSSQNAKAERDHLHRERDNMGPVNLRAEVELEEAATEQERLEAEKNDLSAAIARLRQGIDKLNDEARERIVKTFADVNEHFKHLFTRLFGGGEAYLKMVDSDDPLDAGLEIFAQPPGKSLQSLSLLSGGEQTLTALAMIFAMFLSNPAPVCVLDEVDAPLDDANVDRVCTLLEEMASSCSTRFMVITHHRMTMARMDRLYGVTMRERGVSQLVSVNLAAQGELLAEHQAA